MESYYVANIINLKGQNLQLNKLLFNLYDVSLYANKDWSQMSKFLVENLPKFERAFHSFVEKISF
jgi:hypothetical protein